MNWYESDQAGHRLLVNLKHQFYGNGLQICPGLFPFQKAMSKIDDYITGSSVVRLRKGTTSVQLLSILHKLEKR